MLIDDKVRILASVKEAWGRRLTTVFPRQGHYARDPVVADYPQPDIVIDRISGLLDYGLTALVNAAWPKG